MTPKMAGLAACRLCVAWLLLAPAAQATDYYIDVTRGSDANDGKSEAAAWQRLARIGQAPLKPGDRILLKRGELWKEPLPVPASGTRDNPITYTAYGKGDQPKIVAEQHAVEIARKSGITLEDLDITGSVYTIFIHAREGEYSGFVFRNCRITSLGGRGQMPSGHCIHQASEPIITEKDGKRVADEGSAVFRNLVISGCTLTPGRQGWANGINLHNNVTDFTIENNVIGPAGEDAILLWNCKRGRVTGNKCGGNGENSIDIKNASDVTVSHNSCTNDNYGGILLHEIMFLEGHKPNDLNQRVVIEHNVITGAGQCFKQLRSAPEITAGIWLKNSDDCSVRYNRLVDCLGIGIQVDDAESSQNNNQLYGNVIVGAGAGQLDWCAGIFLEDCVGTKVFNNLVYNQKTGAGIALRGGRNTAGIQVLNNIVTLAPVAPGANPPGGAAVLIRLRPEAGTGLVCDYNCYWPDWGDGFGGSLPGKASLARGSLRAWQEAFQLDVHSFAVDPKLKDPATLVFQLRMDDPTLGRMLRPWATIVPHGPGKAIQADARNNETPWHVFFALPAGVLQGGQDYVVSLNYEIVDVPDPQACFFMYAGIDALGAGPKQMVKWTGKAGEKGQAVLNVSQPRQNGAVLQIGVNRKGALLVTGLEIREGSTWNTIPVEGSGKLSPSGRPVNEAALPIGAEEFKIQPPAPTTSKVVSVADFGAVADGPGGPAAGADGNRQAFMRAIAACKGGQAATLLIPRGVYRITVKEPILFEDLEDVVVDGQGSELIFSKLALPAWPAAVEINRCRRCVIRDLKIDWDWDTAPLAYVGRILARADDGTFDMEFPDVTEIPENIAWRSFWPLDKTTRGFARDGEWHFTPRNVKKIRSNVLRGTPPWPLPVQPGDLFLIRQFEYERHAFHMTDNSDLSLQGIDVYSMPGMGWVTRHNMHHWEMVECRITPRPGSRRPITCTADGLNTEDSLGYFRMLRCDFGWTGDDCVNIKDLTNVGVTVVDKKTLVVGNVNFDRHPYAVGDLIELRRADHSPIVTVGARWPGFASKLQAVTLDKTKKQATLTFADDLPADLSPATILVNRRFDTCNILIRDCVFHDNRNRGILLNARGGTIENCRFGRIQSEPILIESSATPRWSEGTGMTNLVIRGNTFDRCNPKGTFEAAMICIGTDMPGGDSAYPCTHGVLIEGNRFVDFPGLSLRLVSCRDVFVRNNTFENPSPLPEPLAFRGVIRAWQAAGLQVLGNTWIQSSHVRLPSVQTDPKTTQDVTVESNTVKSGAVTKGR